MSLLSVVTNAGGAQAAGRNRIPPCVGEHCGPPDELVYIMVGLIVVLCLGFYLSVLYSLYVHPKILKLFGKN